MHQWYFSNDGQQVGPLDHAAAVRQVQQMPQGHCWRQGFAEWLPVAHVAELSASTVGSSRH